MLIEFYLHSICVKRRVIDFLAGRQPNFRRPSPTTQPSLRRIASMILLSQENPQAEPRRETEDERAKRLQNELLGIQIEVRRNA
jgi:hypothetical protein